MGAAPTLVALPVLAERARAQPLHLCGPSGNRGRSAYSRGNMKEIETSRPHPLRSRHGGARDGTPLPLPRTSRFSLAAVAALAACPSVGWAQELTPDEARVSAREAYIYGYPIVESYKAMYASALDAEGEDYRAPFNTLEHEDAFTPAGTHVRTPNVDVLYSFLWMDLRSEPLVLGVPGIDGERYYSIQMIDLYNYTARYIGSRTTGQGAGRYVIAGPDWAGQTPEGTDQVIRIETPFAVAIYRTEVRGPDDVELADEVRAQFDVQSLSGFLGEPRPTVAAEALPALEDGADPELAFLSTLASLMRFCPPHASEVELMARLARIGVTPDTPFSTDAMPPDLVEALRAGLQDGAAAISTGASTYKVSEVVGTREDLGGDYLKRAVAASVGRYSNIKEEVLSPLYLTDAAGAPLDAREANYVLRLGSQELPPVDAFWSVTMYDGQSNALVANAIDRYRISSSMIPALARDSRDGLTLYVQREPPPEELAANWLPAPDGPFYLVLRLYWPRPEAYDGTWTPPLIWKAEAAPAPAVLKPTGTEAAEEVKAPVLVEEPKPEMERPTIWGEPTEVQILLFVIDVDELDSADQSFAASVYIQASWKNPFLRHKGPGPMHRNVSDVWSPRLAITGQQMAWLTYPEAVEIEPDGTVVYRQKVWGRFSQPLQLVDFPFDRQELTIQIVAAGLMEEHVKMVSLVNAQGRTSSIAEEFSLPDFEVVSWNAGPKAYNPVDEGPGVAGYELRMVVQRRSMYFILKVIVPLCLIVIMSWLPRWIDPDEIGTNIGISTSAFLTLVAYLFAITVLLPRVSYITRMDRFILLSTLTVFAGLLQTVANTVLVGIGRKHRSDQIDRWSRALYPGLLGLVLYVSFIL